MTQQIEKGMAKIEGLPTSLEEVRGMADAFVKSGMFSDTKQIAQAIVKIQAGRELGLPPVYSMQNINLIRDRLTTSANTMAMLVKRSGKYNYKIGSHTDTECKIEFLEDGKTAGWSTFTIDDAKRANLVKPESGWIKFPRAMLFSRAISQGARIYCPDAIGGIYTDEEIRSIPPRQDEADLTEKSKDKLEPSSTSETSQKQGIEAETGNEAPATQENAVTASKSEGIDKAGKGKRDTSTIKTITDMYKACHADFGLQPAEVMKELNITQWGDLILTPVEAYNTIAAPRVKSEIRRSE